MGRLHSPERSREPSDRRLRAVSLGAIVLLCAAFTIAIGDETARLTVMNRTPNVLTIVIADRTWKSVPAGAGVTYSSTGSDTLAVTASYAPGQDVTGSVQRSFFFVSTHPQGSYTYIACGVNAPIVTPIPIQWNVTADTLASR